MIQKEFLEKKIFELAMNCKNLMFEEEWQRVKWLKNRINEILKEKE